MRQPRQVDRAQLDTTQRGVAAVLEVLRQTSAEPSTKEDAIADYYAAVTRYYEARACMKAAAQRLREALKKG